MKRYFLPIVFLLVACDSENTQKDTTAPVITIVGSNPLDASYSVDFTDPGATATDNKDGSIEVSVESTVIDGVPGTYTIAYTATDSSGNESTAERVVNIIDDIAPVITPSSNDDVIVEVYEKYYEFGATAFDEIDGEVEVNIESNLNVNTVGEYTVTYSASDSSGNTSEFSRNITVTPQQVTIKFSVFGEGSITNGEGYDITCTDSRECEVTVDVGTELSFAATAENGYNFVYWKNCDSTTGSTCSITANSDSLLHLGFSSSQSLSISDNVIVFSEDQINSIVDYDELTGLLTLSSGTDISEFDVGTILVSTGIYTSSGDSSNVEIYFARRIEKINVLGLSNILIDTAEVALDEFIAEGDIAYSTVLTYVDVDTATLPEGISINKDRLLELTSQSATQSLDVIPFTIDVTINDMLSVSGSVDITVDPDVNLSFSLINGLQEFKLTSDASINSTLGLEIKGELKEEDSINIGSPVRFAPIVVGPIVFIPELQLKLAYSATATASFSPSVTVAASMSAGAHYLKTAGWRPVKSFNLDASANLGLEEFDVALDVNSGPGLELGFLLYGSVGPAVSATAVAGVSASPIIPASENCTFDLSSYLGFTSKFKGVFKLISKKFEYEVNLLKTKYQISSTAGECSYDKPLPPEPVEVNDIGVDSVTLTWTPNDSNNNVTYYLYQGFDLIQSALTDAEFEITDLKPNTEYCFIVIAENTNDEALQSEPSDAACATTLSEDEYTLDIPTDIYLEAQSTTSIYINWSDNRQSSSFDYILYQVIDGAYHALERTDSSYGYALGLSPDTEYCFAVSMVNDNGEESDKSGTSCTSTYPAEYADWTIYLACQGRDYLIEEQLDLDEDISSVISVVGEANDYDGTPLIYSLSGLYNNETYDLDGNIVWTFEDSTNRRVDEFQVNLSSGDTGDVNMDQVEVTGCDAMIRFLKDDASEESITPQYLNKNSTDKLHNTIF